MKVIDNQFVIDFFHPYRESSCIEIAADLSFQDSEFIFHKLSSWINRIIELLSHFLTISSSDNFIYPGAYRYNRFGMKIFLDQLRNRFETYPLSMT